MKRVQVSLIICGRFLTSNLEFANKKYIFDWKFVILDKFGNGNKQIYR